MVMNPMSPSGKINNSLNHTDISRGEVVTVMTSCGIFSKRG